MWSARWGHSVIVFNSTSPRNDLTVEENSAKAEEMGEKIIVLGGDDYDMDYKHGIMPGEWIMDWHG